MRITKGKKNEGITLIALVITIIVLLILAGITIATLTGDNGILTKTQIAREETIMKSLKEEVEILLQEDYINTTFKQGNNLKDVLQKVSGNKKIDKIKDFEDVYYVTRDGVTITV